MLVPDDRFSQVAGIAGMRADQAVPAKDYASSEGVIEINLIALKNGSTRRKQVIQVDIPPLATWGPCACGRANWFFRPVSWQSGHLGRTRRTASSPTCPASILPSGISPKWMPRPRSGPFGKQHSRAAQSSLLTLGSPYMTIVSQFEISSSDTRIFAALVRIPKIRTPRR
jgi:hypothetical protein